MHIKMMIRISPIAPAIRDVVTASSPSFALTTFEEISFKVRLSEPIRIVEARVSASSYESSPSTTQLPFVIAD